MNTRTPQFAGAYTAIVTPFRDGRVDEPALERLLQAQIRGGIDGVVAVGTTGESPTLNMDEHIRVVELCVQFAKGKLKVIAGTGANATEEAIHLTKAAEGVGADAHLQVAPYYNKPSQEGLFQHFHAVARATKLPVLLYNIPGRCGVDISVETVDRLARDSINIVGIKEAGGNPDRVSELRAVLGGGFSILSGDDALTLPFMAVGAHGVISVASNVIPRDVARMVHTFAQGKPALALKLHDRFHALFKALFIETNPAPVKTALALLGQIEEEIRLPLVRVSPASRKQLKATLKGCGLLP
jgi:4-hydroxy-tetrahydrodipicolinate synthase